MQLGRRNGGNRKGKHTSASASIQNNQSKLRNNEQLSLDKPDGNKVMSSDNFWTTETSASIASNGYNTGSNVCLECCSRLTVNSIECDGCHSWICLTCAKISTKTCKFIGENLQMDAFKFLCKKCQVRFDRCFIDTGIIPSSEKPATSTSNSAIPTNTVLMEKLTKIVVNCVHEEMKAAAEIEKRKKNLIIFGLKESWDDRMQLRNLFNELQVEQVSIADSFRLGRNNPDGYEGKPRPMLVALSSFSQKREIMQHVFRLKQSASFNRVYIRPDRPREQRERKNHHAETGSYRKNHNVDLQSRIADDEGEWKEVNRKRHRPPTVSPSQTDT